MKTTALLLLALVLTAVACQPSQPKVVATLPNPMETLLAHSGTGGEPAAWTVRIKDNACTFVGPNTIPHSNLTVKLVIDEQKPTESGYALVTLQGGKSIEDLKALPSADMPSWVNLVDTGHQSANGTYMNTYDYTNETSTDPLYLSCFRADPASGSAVVLNTFGPFEIK